MDNSVVSDDIVLLAQRAAADLQANGYAVIPNIISENRCEELRNSLNSTMDQVCRSQKRGAWKDSLSMSKGIVMDPPDLFHCRAVWEARKITAPYFAALYGTGDLWSSFDRFNVMTRGTKVESWLHTDQSGLCNGLFCVQGFLDVVGTTEKDAGLVVVEKSHLRHFELMKQWNAQRKQHWYRLRANEAQEVRESFRVVKVLCPPGSLVLWDSRTIHENAPMVAGGKDRCVFYTCCLPREMIKSTSDRVYQELKEKKQKMFRDRLCTSHWAVLAEQLCVSRDKSKSGGESRYNVSDEVIQQPDPDTDQMVASLSGFSEVPAIAYNGAPLVELGPGSQLLHGLKK